MKRYFLMDYTHLLIHIDIYQLDPKIFYSIFSFIIKNHYTGLKDISVKGSKTSSKSNIFKNPSAEHDANKL